MCVCVCVDGRFRPLDKTVSQAMPHLVLIIVSSPLFTDEKREMCLFTHLDNLYCARRAISLSPRSHQ